MHVKTFMLTGMTRCDMVIGSPLFVGGTFVESERSGSHKAGIPINDGKLIIFIVPNLFFLIWDLQQELTTASVEAVDHETRVRPTHDQDGHGGLSLVTLKS